MGQAEPVEPDERCDCIEGTYLCPIHRRQDFCDRCGQALGAEYEEVDGGLIVHEDCLTEEER